MELPDDLHMEDSSVIDLGSTRDSMINLVSTSLAHSRARLRNWNKINTIKTTNIHPADPRLIICKQKISLGGAKVGKEVEAVVSVVVVEAVLVAGVAVAAIVVAAMRSICPVVEEALV